MDQQLDLFEKTTQHWVERLWARVGAEQREAVLNTLAQMAADSLKCPPQTHTKDNADES